MKRTAKIVASAVVAGVALTGCTADDSDVVDKNITKAAKNFEVQRRIVVFNNITDKILLQVEGRCNVDPSGNRIFFTCKVADGTGPDSYVRNQAYVGDNVTTIIEQGEPIKVSAYQYRVTYKPQTVIPDVDFRGSMDEGPQTQD